MNKRQRLVQQQFLDNEEAVIRRLKAVYNQSLKDIEHKTKVLQNEINGLQAAYDAIEDEKERARLKSMQQSKIYQKGYQDALKKQINSILDNMQVEEFETVADYLNKCYEEGFLGAVYDIHGQGIPVMFPIDQEAVVRAVQLDSKISKGLYQRLGEDIDLLKRKITAQVSRGISTGMSFEQVSQQLSAYTNIGFNNAVRIARTEGHRIQVQSGMDACYKAKEKGADVVKQWDSTLDGSTRESHQKVDGEIRELDKPFSNGLMFPGDPSGGAAEVVNCRCALLQRAKWALDEQELVTLKERADYYGLDKSDNFKDFKKKYLKAVEKELENSVKSIKIIFEEAKSIKEAETFAKSLGIQTVSFKGADVRTANAMNRSLVNALNYSPEIKERMKFYGVTQERNKLLKADLESYYDKWYRTKYPNQTDEWYAKYAKKAASRSVGKVGTNNWATAFSGKVNSSDAELVGIIQKYSGVGVNVKVAKDSEGFLESLKYNVKSKFHPIGCDTIESVFDHEFGHQIDYAFSLSDDSEIKRLWASFRAYGNQERSDLLSTYAYKDGLIQEFIAEGYAEYINNENPRDFAKAIGEIIERKVKGNE